MTEQEFKNRRFRHSQLVDYVNPRTKDRIECLLIGVNFDGGTLNLWAIPFETETHILEEGCFWVFFEYVFPPLSKLKAIK